VIAPRTKWNATNKEAFAGPTTIVGRLDTRSDNVGISLRMHISAQQDTSPPLRVVQ